MRSISRGLIAGGAAAVAFGMIATGGVAQADPSSPPKHTDIVGVGAQTDQDLFTQFSADYNPTVGTGRPVFDWDADTGGTISPKADCAAITRPNGANAGITALEANAHPNGDATNFCIDFARDSRPRAASDPSNILFIPFAIDAVTWSKANKGTLASHAPKNLSTLQLKAIYSCDGTIIDGAPGPVTWNEVGGSGTNAVVPVIPPSTAGTRSFFLSQIGVTTLGSCVKGQDNSVEQNEGTNPIFSGSQARDVIFPYSVAVYLAQTIHNHGAGDQGPLLLGQVDGVKPTAGSGSTTKININFPYVREIYNVVRNGSTTGQSVPTYLQKLFGTGALGSGWICKNSTAKADIKSFGFLPDTDNCGTLQ